MGKSIFLLLLASIVASCTVSNRITPMNDSANKSKNKLQTDMFIELCNERIRIDSGNHMKNHLNIIPENLWISIVCSQKIGWILYSGKEPINLQLNQLQTTKLKEFLKQAIQKRDAKFPDIPDGKKKW